MDRRVGRCVNLQGWCCCGDVLSELSVVVMCLVCRGGGLVIWGAVVVVCSVTW